MSIGTRGEPEWRDAFAATRARWHGRPGEETDQDEPPRLSLARKLESAHSLVGRSAHWLFIKGGMVVLLIPGLILLGLIAGYLRGR